MRIRQIMLCIFLSGLITTGCVSPERILERSVDRGVDRAVDSAFEAAGARVGEAVGEAIVREYTPRFTRWYTNYLMEMAFYAGGYSVEGVARDYSPGEYTQWLVAGEGDEEINRMRRAYLGDDEEGNQWWQIVFEDASSEDTMILEALFTPDRDQLLRLRTKFPNEDEPTERPVEDQQYRSPSHLTVESIEGATETIEEVTVPAGSFEARRVAYGSGHEGRRIWWMSDEVPGGIVRFGTEHPRAEDDAPDDAEEIPVEGYFSELEEYGSNARSRLGTEIARGG